MNFSHMIKKILNIGIIIALTHNVFAQSYAPEPGQLGTTAIHKDSALIVSWATTVEVNRGYLDIENKSSGLVNFGTSEEAIGKAQGNSVDVVSLGDSGVAILTFDRPITNGPGPDFAVFENGFSDHFMELAFVEVSSDGVLYERFPSVSEIPNDIQLGPFELSNCAYIHNLAGKYRQGYGTPFDLDDLLNTGLDLNRITHVKIIDEH